jgi:hypothetical protein
VNAGGQIIVGGSFTTAGGVNANRIARLDAGGWAPLGAGLSNTSYQIPAVYSLIAHPDGGIIAGGRFDRAGAVASVNVARWDGSAWSAMGGVAGQVNCLAVDAAGGVIAGGTGIIVQGSNIARWNGTVWSPIGAGLGAGAGESVEAVCVLRDGRVVAGGVFGGGNIAMWDGSAWTPLGEGLNGAVLTVAEDESGNILAGGMFTGSGSRTVLRAAQWDGSQWKQIVHGLDDYVCSIQPLPNGDVAVGGAFTTDGRGPAGAYLTLRLPTADFDGDGDAATDADIEAFFACLAGDCCGTCATSDFDRDGDAATDADIEAFFRVLAGGSC